MREQILGEIRRLAEENGGKAPGSRAFGHATGIRESTWRGVYWARWSEAVIEAGLTPNRTSTERRIADDTVLAQVARACRDFGRVPTVAELRLYRRQHIDFPDVKTIERRFNGFSQLATHVLNWARAHAEFEDVAKLLGANETSVANRRAVDGSVYLLQSGAFYKVGRSDQLERRIKEIRVALPDAAKLVHAIATDDPPGIEAYWHRRFADKRANGEWFKLAAADVAAFKRRRFQ